jgi:hypothetical protein
MNCSTKPLSFPFAALSVVAVAFIAFNVDAGSPVYVGVKTTPPVPLESIDQSAWNSLLNKYVDQNGRVDYRAWKSDAADLASLEQYLVSLSGANASARAAKSVKLAYWINAYNALTIHGILREYPTTSIRNHTAKLFGYNIWNDLPLYVGGKPYSLDTMEHKILRKMNEPRIHFAIVCASIGCPRLANEAYDPKRIDQQLTANAKDFFARNQNFRYDAAASRFSVSSILDWFGEDFGRDQASRLRKIAEWLPSTASREAALRNSVSLSFLQYDWALNSQ